MLIRLRRLSVPLDLAALREGSGALSTEAALGIALLSMFLLGLGGWLWWLSAGLGVVVSPGAVFIRSTLFGTVVSFALWLGWLLVGYAVLQRLTATAIPVERLLREGGMATAPLALGVLMVIPYLSFGIGIAAIGVWAIAMQGAFERATGQRGLPVFLANGAGFSLWAIVLSLLGAGGHTFAPGPFLAHSVWEWVARSAAHMG